MCASCILYYLVNYVLQSGLVTVSDWTRQTDAQKLQEIQK